MKTKETNKPKDLATSPEVRVVVDFFLINDDESGLIRINLGGSETDQSVEVLYTCFCEETCYRIAYIQKELL